MSIINKKWILSYQFISLESIGALFKTLSQLELEIDTFVKFSDTKNVKIYIYLGDGFLLPLKLVEDITLSYIIKKCFLNQIKLVFHLFLIRNLRYWRLFLYFPAYSL